MKQQKLKTSLRCKLCPATADLSKNPKAWNGWAIIPIEICPECIAKATKQRQEAAEKEAARVRLALSMLEGGQA